MKLRHNRHPVDPLLPGLLSLLSHELRAPLGVMRGYLRLLDQQDAPFSAQQRQAIAAALRASDRAAELLAQASTLAQLGRGEAVFNFEEVAVEPLLAAAVDAVELPTDPAVGLQLAAIPSATVTADEALLRSAMVSLLGAAVRAQPRDTTLVVRARIEEGSDGEEIIVSAAPTTAQALEEAELNLSRGGLGLDLPIARHLIAAHRGRVRELREAEQTMGVIVCLPTSS
jgi:signal transduction histidine kinase